MVTFQWKGQNDGQFGSKEDEKNTNSFEFSRQFETKIFRQNKQKSRCFILSWLVKQTTKFWLNINKYEKGEAGKEDQIC